VQLEINLETNMVNLSRPKQLAAIPRVGAAAPSAQVTLVLFLVLVVFASLPAVAQNPVPLINQPLTPDSIAPGGTGLNLTVTGTGFVSGSVVNWNGSPRTTTFVSNEKLTAAITSADISKNTTATVTVTNPAPGGGTSNGVFFSSVASFTTISLVRSDISVGNTPNAIAAGDFTGSGVLDLAIVNSGDNNVGIYLGNGDGTFQSPTLYPIGHPVAVITGDFNGDGKLDLAVLQQIASQVAIYLGNGDGTFGNPQTFSTGVAPVSLATADLNGDGHLDLAVVNFGTAAKPGNTVSVLLGNGDGTFQAHQDYSTGVNPTSVAIGDFNGDGWLDLAVCNNNDNTVSILLNNKSGGFPTHTDLATAAAPTAVITADFNGDGKLDLALSTAARAASVLLGNGDGTFQTHKEYTTGADSQAIAAADLNADGKLDLVVLNLADNSISILKGKGDGTFQVQALYPTNLGPGALSVGDFNSDGKLDLAVVDSTANMLSVLTEFPLTVTPTVVQFNHQEEGIVSTPQTITLKNSSAFALDLASASIGGTNAADFAIESNNCVGSLAANASCTLSVTFDPSTMNFESGQVVITETSGNSTGAGLTGYGQIGVTLGPTRNYIFKTQLINTTSPAAPFTFTNDSGVTITNLTFLVNGMNYQDFSQTNNCGTSLAAGQSCTIFFNPVFCSSCGTYGVGQETGAMNVFGNFSPGNGQQAVLVSGVSTAVAVNPVKLTFPATTVGTSSSPKIITFKNAGTVAMPISSRSFQGADAGDFSETDNCGSSVAGGSSCTFKVTFTPKATGTRTATLQIGDPDPTGPQAVSLTGTGQ
jgi:hypothetical protein